MRWLFISIIILYGYSTPGIDWIGTETSWWPSRDGFVLAVEKIALLCLLVLSVNVWFGNMAESNWLIGIESCLKPLSIFRIDRERWLLRIALTMKELSQLHEQTEKRDTNPISARKKLQTIANAAAKHFSETVNKPIELQPIELAEITRPRWYEWFLPIMIAVLYLFTNMALILS